MIRQRLLWMLTAILICGSSATMLTSCNQSDNPVGEFTNPLGESLYGTWFAMQELGGPINGITCKYVGQAAEFYEDGSGVWYFFMLNDVHDPVYLAGSRTKAYGKFHYQADEDGTITIRLDIDQANQLWTMRLHDGKITAPLTPDVMRSADAYRARTRGGETETITLLPATAEESSLVNKIAETADATALLNIKLADAEGKPINASSVIIAANGAQYSFNMDVPTSEYQLSLVGIDGKTLQVAATNGTDTYVCTQTGVAFKAGETYSLDLKLTKVETVQLWEGGPKFASLNIGANSETETGLSYAWGAVTDNRQLGLWYHWPYAPYYNGSTDGKQQAWTKYNGTDHDTLLPEDDAATANWGAPWRLPTVEEAERLTDPRYCTAQWYDDYNGSGRAGMLVTGATGGYTDKSVFFAAGGGYSKGSVVFDKQCDYWASKLHLTNAAYWNASFFWMDGWGGMPQAGISYGLRCNGRSVRPVRD